MYSIITRVLGRSQREYPHYVKSNIHTTSIVNTKCAGRYKPSINKDRPLTYEQAWKPDQIGYIKSFQSINTGGLTEGIRTAEVSLEDILIRNFIHGTWPGLKASEVIIKRRGNQIICNFIVLRKIKPAQIYFLIGYTEEVLSYLLKSVVKLEITTIDELDELTYKYI